jgi:HK97 family phage portal protein
MSPWPWQKKEPEERGSAEWGNSTIPPPGMGAGGMFAHTGRYVSADQAAGLAAVGSAVRLIAETIGSLPLVVWSGDGADRQRAMATWQYQLLHDRPNMDQSAMEFWSDVSACLEFSGNAYLQKVKAGKRVVELQIVDPNAVRVYRDRDTREKRYDVTVDGNRYAGLTSSDVLHIRGFTLRGGLQGVSPIAEHRNTLSVAMAAEEFAGRSYANDATPGLAITVPGNLGRQQAAEMLQVWNATHAGLSNAQRPAVLTNGATLDKLGMTLADAELIVARRYGVEEVARIFRLPPAMLGVPNAGTNQSAEEESLRFVRYGLMPRLRRIEMALRADDDLFPTAGPLQPEWLVDGLLRADTATRYQAHVLALQSGFMSKNEVRAVEGLPPIDGGDQIQLTPVGGAPNPDGAPIGTTPTPDVTGAGD